MGSTILQAMSRTREGLLLWESFESVDFASDQGWTIFQGTPTISTDQAFNELHSLEMDSSYPQIRHAFDVYRWAAGYFYDDATETASTFIPAMQFVTAGGDVYALGVNNAVSTTHYVYGVNGVYTATAVARTTGWHRFRAVDAEPAPAFSLLIDGTSVYANTTTYAGPLTSLRVGAVNAASTAFGFFDLIQAASDWQLTFLGFDDGAVATLYQEDGTALGQAAVASGVAAFSSLGVLASLDMPQSLYTTVTQSDGVLPYYRTPVLEMSIGDAWTFSAFDLGRRLPSFQLTRPSMRDDKESGAGVNESLFYFSRDVVRLTLSDLTDAQRQAFMRFWGAVCDGSVFSAAIDSGNLYAGQLAADTVPGDETLELDSVVGLNLGSDLMLTRSNGQRFEVGTVASVTPSPTNEVELTTPPVFGYEEGDQVRHVYYWPYAITTDKEPGIRLTNPKLKRWAIEIGFKEALF